MSNIANQLWDLRALHSAHTAERPATVEARPPVYEEWRFAPALQPEHHRDRMLALRWHLGALQILLRDPGLAELLQRSLFPLSAVADPDLAPPVLKDTAEAVENIRQIAGSTPASQLLSMLTPHVTPLSISLQTSGVGVRLFMGLVA